MKHQEFLNKMDLFNYLNSGIDKSGNLKKEGGFRKHYPIFYDEYLKISFQDEINKLPFKLTKAQLRVLEEIENRLNSESIDVNDKKILMALKQVYNNYMFKSSRENDPLLQEKKKCGRYAVC